LIPGPNFHIRKAAKKNLAPRLIIDAKKHHKINIKYDGSYYEYLVRNTSGGWGKNYDSVKARIKRAPYP
jgi:hypothetical protein